MMLIKNAFLYILYLSLFFQATFAGSISVENSSSENLYEEYLKFNEKDSVNIALLEEFYSQIIFLFENAIDESMLINGNDGKILKSQLTYVSCLLGREKTLPLLTKLLIIGDSDLPIGEKTEKIMKLIYDFEMSLSEEIVTMYVEEQGRIVDFLSNFKEKIPRIFAPTISHWFSLAKTMVMKTLSNQLFFAVSSTVISALIIKKIFSDESKEKISRLDTEKCYNILKSVGKPRVKTEGFKIKMEKICKKLMNETRLYRAAQLYDVINEAEKIVRLGGDRRFPILAKKEGLTGFFATENLSKLKELLFEACQNLNLLEIQNKNDPIKKHSDQPISKKRFSDVAGLEKEKKQLQPFIDIVKKKNVDLLKELDLKIEGGILFWGLPGNGKTLLAEAFAGEMDALFFEKCASDFLCNTVGSGAKAIRILFNKARKKSIALKRTSVIFIDEIEVFFKKDDGFIDHHEQARKQLMSELNKKSKHEPIIIMATNCNPENFDKALTRDGRIDLKIEIPNPIPKDREKILNFYISRITCADNEIKNSEYIKHLAGKTDKYTSAQLRNLIDEAKKIVYSEHNVSGGSAKVMPKHIDMAFTKMNEQRGNKR